LFGFGEFDAVPEDAFTPCVVSETEFQSIGKIERFRIGRLLYTVLYDVEAN